MTRQDGIDSAALCGAHYARNGWRNCDTAVANWLLSGEEKPTTCVAILGSFGAEAAFVRGYQAERAKGRRGP